MLWGCHGRGRCRLIHTSLVLQHHSTNSSHQFTRGRIGLGRVWRNENQRSLLLLVLVLVVVLVLVLVLVVVVLLLLLRRQRRIRGVLHMLMLMLNMGRWVLRMVGEGVRKLNML